MIKLIFCSDLAGNIGKDNDLLFKYKEDMQFFRDTTLGSTMLMGYKTYESLDSQPLPKRLNLVLTRKKNVELKDNMMIVDNLEKTINDFKQNYPNDDLYIIGGASVYNKSLELGLVDEVLITIVWETVKDADTKVNLSLIFDQFPYKERIKEFIAEDGNKVEIYRYYK